MVQGQLDKHIIKSEFGAYFIPFAKNQLSTDHQYKRERGKDQMPAWI